MNDRAARLRAAFDGIGQGHVFSLWPRLGPRERVALLDDLDALRTDEIQAAWASVAAQGGEAPLLSQNDLPPIRPVPRIPPPNQEAAYQSARRCAEKLLRRGAVAALTVAGGQGSRLGFDGPKGAFPIGPISGSCLFRLFAESLLRSELRCGKAIPWYVMTSNATHDRTVALFADHAYFGLDPSLVTLFRQGAMPAFSSEGRILLADRHRLAMAPDGHGGVLQALARSGALERMREDGTEHVSYFQVDNPLVRCIDPLFLGLHAQAGAEVSVKVIPKASDREGLGNLCLRQGRLTCIEYSDFPNELAAARNPDGTRRYDAGGISIYAFSTTFLRRMATLDGGLPWHRAVKKVPQVDPATGDFVGSPQGIKLERFLFDVLPLAIKTLVLETTRSEEFSPVKNAVGVDSAGSCRQALVRRACAWLSAAGVHVPWRADGEPDAVVEVSPLYADSPEDLAARTDLPARIQPGERLLLGGPSSIGFLR